MITLKKKENKINIAKNKKSSQGGLFSFKKRSLAEPGPLQRPTICLNLSDYRGNRGKNKRTEENTRNTGMSVKLLCIIYVFLSFFQLNRAFIISTESQL